MSAPSISRRWWVTLNVAIGIFMSTLDASIVNLSLPTIIRSLDTQLSTVAWVVTAYLIIITGCLLLMGRLADLFGQRKTYLLGFFAFTVGSALCGISPTIHFLIGSRVIQGLGASALMAIGPAIITTAFPEKDRGKALGMVGSIVSVGFLTGPLVGGFLIEHLGWRSIFFVNLPVGVAGICLSSIILEGKGASGKVRLDLWGALLIFISITSLLLSLNRLGKGWLFMCLLSFGLFILVEHRASSPLVDLHLFRRRLFTSSIGASILSFSMNGAHTFVIPFFLQNILEFSPSKVGMLIFPVALTVMVVAPLGGRFSDRVGVAIPATMGLILTSFAVLSFIFLKTPVNDYEIILRQVIFGIGLGLFNPSNNSAIIGSLPREKVGLASSFLALSRNLGIVMGVAIAEMVIAFGISSTSLEKGGGAPPLEAIQRVWKLFFIVGVTATVLSWARKKS